MFKEIWSKYVNKLTSERQILNGGARELLESDMRSSDWTLMVSIQFAHDEE